MSTDNLLSLLALLAVGIIALGGVVAWALANFADIRRDYVRRDDHDKAFAAHEREISLLRPKVHELSTHVNTILFQVEMLVRQAQKRDERDESRHSENSERLEQIAVRLARLVPDARFTPEGETS